MKTSLFVKATLCLASSLGLSHNANALLHENIFASPVEGVLLEKGMPLVGHTVERRAGGTGLPEEGVKTTATTNENGQFSFAVLKNKTLFYPRNWAAPTAVLVVYEVMHQGVTYQLFVDYKQHLEASPDEKDGKISLVCDLADLHPETERQKANTEKGDTPRRSVKCLINGKVRE